MGGGVSVLDFIIDGETMTGITFFMFDRERLVSRLEEVWPQPYDRPSSRAHLTELM